MENDYLLNLIKVISWPFDDLFVKDDKKNIKRNVKMSDKQIDGLISTGQRKDNADERNLGMWMVLNESITKKKGDTLEHYFENVYKKIACCTGKSSITVPILVQDSDGKIKKTYKTITLDKSDCIMNGQDWYDDNMTEAKYNTNCNRFMERLIAFLTKYDPENEIITTVGGCLANKNIPDSFLKNPMYLSILNTNRSCLLPTCNEPDAYKRKSDRKTCSNTICNAEFNVSNLEAGEAIKLFKNSIEQNCGNAAGEIESSAYDKILEAEKEKKKLEELEEEKKKLEEDKKIANEEEKKQIEEEQKKLEEKEQEIIGETKQEGDESEEAIEIDEEIKKEEEKQETNEQIRKIKTYMKENLYLVIFLILVLLVIFYFIFKNIFSSPQIYQQPYPIR